MVESGDALPSPVIDGLALMAMRGIWMYDQRNEELYNAASSRAARSTWKPGRSWGVENHSSSAEATVELCDESTSQVRSAGFF